MKEYDIDTVEARKAFADVLNTVAYGDARVVIARRGRMMCAVVPLRDLMSEED
jgi:prevent-host-death family protein